jgi:hypothetical protein
MRYRTLTLKAGRMYSSGGGSLMAIVRHKQPPLRRLMMYGWITCARPLPAWVSCGATRSPP